MLDVAAAFKSHRAQVYRWAYALSASHADAADLTQEAFLRLLRSGSVAPRQVVGWLRKVTTRLAIDRWRAKSAARRALKAVQPSEQTAAAIPAFEQRETLARMHAALGELSEQQRLVLLAKCFDEATFQQIADELGLGVPTVKTHYLRALHALRARLNQGESLQEPVRRSRT